MTSPPPTPQRSDLHTPLEYKQGYLPRIIKDIFGKSIHCKLQVNYFVQLPITSFRNSAGFPSGPGAYLSISYWTAVLSYSWQKVWMGMGPKSSNSLIQSVEDLDIALGKLKLFLKTTDLSLLCHSSRGSYGLNILVLGRGIGVTRVVSLW